MPVKRQAPDYGAQEVEGVRQAGRAGLRLTRRVLRRLGGLAARKTSRGLGGLGGRQGRRTALPGLRGAGGSK